MNQSDRSRDKWLNEYISKRFNMWGSCRMEKVTIQYKRRAEHIIYTLFKDEIVTETLDTENKRK